MLLLFACLMSLALSQTPGQRAKALLAKMSLDEKLAMVHGYPGDYVGDVNPNSRLNIPALHLEDGPQGVADGVQKTTCWPSALTVVATWDTNLMFNWGMAMGLEQRMKGTNIALGPMVNIARVPGDGRNFESMGEDPYLASQMVKHNVKGVQSQGVMACVKHWAANNQEYHRTSVSENVDERTLQEIYFPAFRAAIDAGVGSVMCSYNKINHIYACENMYTLTTVMKNMWGFTGFVMSDWGATHSTIMAANNGLDMQMPDASYFGQPLADAVKAGNVTVSRIDDMVLRILTSMYAIGIFDRPQTGNLGVDTRSAKHTALARELATAANVLVKNTNILPIDKKRVHTIAIIGDYAKNPIVAGGGSGHVIPTNVITPFDGISAAAGNIKILYAPSNPVSDAAKIAASADLAIIFVAVTSSEGTDRTTLALPDGQDGLISAVVARQPNSVVVVNTPGAILMPWVEDVPGIVVSFMPGQEDGHAIADILFGAANPSGRLPVTFPVTDSQTPINTPQQYPGINDNASYSEGLFVGYRWYDENHITPLFPFGHGLSYTIFQYYNLQIKTTGSAGNKGNVTVSFSLQNTGSMMGAEVSQLYVGFPSSASEPPKLLRGFTKVSLSSGDTAVVMFVLVAQDLSVWDVKQHNWVPVSGNFTVYVGASSRDIKMMGGFSY